MSSLVTNDVVKGLNEIEGFFSVSIKFVDGSEEPELFDGIRLNLFDLFRTKLAQLCSRLRNKVGRRCDSHQFLSFQQLVR